jgi:uncharacterized protein (DUF952 family)/L-amino acid N-acyltransferase YncA
VGDVVLEELWAGDHVAEPLVPASQMGLGVQHRGAVAYLGQGRLDQPGRKPVTSMSCYDADPANQRNVAVVEDPEVTDRTVVAVDPEMPSARLGIASVQLGVRAGLLHDEDIDAQLQQQIGGGRIKVGKTCTVNRSSGHPPTLAYPDVGSRRRRQWPVRGADLYGIVAAMLFFHIAALSDWTAAQLDGSYTTSTRGRSLADEGFIHCSRYLQIDGVLDSFYGDYEGRLTLLTVSPRRLTSPWQFDDVPGAPFTFPHIYGPLNADAVIATTPLTHSADGRWTYGWFLPGPLATTRLVLRAANGGDWPAYRRTLVEEPVRRYLGGPVSAAEADQRQAEVDAKGCVAVEREGEVVGFLLLGFYRSGDFELSYCFLPEHQNRGYAREAVTTLSEWVFAIFTHLPRLVAVTQLANERSVTLLNELNWTETDHFVEWGERQVMYALANPHPV